eukprot:15354147-Ditylum_brightwellii.AAC.1
MRDQYLGGIVPQVERACSMPWSCWQCCSISISPRISEQLNNAVLKGGDLLGRACGNDHVSLSNKESDARRICSRGQSSSSDALCAKEMLPGGECPGE